MSFNVLIKSQYDAQQEFMIATRVLEGISVAQALELAGNLVHEEVVTELLPAFDDLKVLSAQLNSYDATSGQQVPPELHAEILLKLTEVADGIVDSVYVLMHMSNTLNLPFDEMFAEVHRSNMSKLVHDETTGELKAIKREDGKILKPAGFTPPDLRSIIVRHFNQAAQRAARMQAEIHAAEIAAFNAAVAEKKSAKEAQPEPAVGTQTQEPPHQ